MDKSLAISLGLMALSAITFIAYKHPTAFARLYIPIFFVITFVCGVMITWNIAITITIDKIQALIPPPSTNYKLAIEAIADLKFDIGLVSIVYMLVVVYLVFLLWLPQILKEDEKK